MNSSPDTSLTRVITEDEVKTYERDGVVHLKQIYPEAWVGTLRSNLDEVFAREIVTERGSHADGMSNEGTRMDIVQMAASAKQEQPDIDLSTDGKVDAPMRGRSLVETDVSIWSEPMRRHNFSGPLPALVAQLTRSSKVIFIATNYF